MKIKRRGRRIEVLHLTAREGLSSVFMAQVARPMARLRAGGLAVELCIFAPPGEFLRPTLRSRWRRRLEEIHDLGLPVHRLPATPSRRRDAWSEPALLQRWARRAAGGRLTVHCRGTMATEIALGARRRGADLRVLTDCRGLDAPEIAMRTGIVRNGNIPHLLERARRQGAALREADAIVCVSKALANEIFKQWAPRAVPRAVIPCCTDVPTPDQILSRRNEMRRRLGIEDRFVVGYCGGNAPWQRLSESIDLAWTLHQQRRDVHFLALTADPEATFAKLSNHDIASCDATVLSLPHSEVAGHLAAADIGLLLRDSSDVNRVAAPVKFAEFLAAGVPVVITPGIGDYSDLVAREGLGQVLPDLSIPRHMRALEGFAARVQRRGQAIREECRAFAQKQLSWKANLAALVDLYQELATADADD